MKSLSRILKAVGTVAILAVASSASAAPSQYAANGHYYEAIPSAGSWADANTAALASTHLGLQGHLATISDSGENDFIFSLAPDEFTPNPSLYMLGGFQPAGSPNEPSEGWQWVTGEAFAFTNWNSGEPNDGGNNEDFLAYWTPTSVWNDITGTSEPGYVVEYEPSQNGSAVPEPATLMMLGAGLAGLTVHKVRQRVRRTKSGPFAG